MKKIKLFITLFFFILSYNAVAGVMARPRQIYLLKTEHFDILFSEESANTAKLLADNVDLLYESAFEQVEGARDLRMPIIVSPDSDKLSAEYTCVPYNRIVVFDGVPDNSDVMECKSLLGCVYHEIFLAVSQSVRSSFNQFINKTVGGDGFQPVSLFYLPYSFVEGFTYVEADCLGNDKRFLQILSVAKYEGKFPNWFQAGTVRDIYPGDELNKAAGTGFAAFLMQAYGVEKYSEFWTNCGNFNFRTTSGMYKKVYGKSLKKLWAEFEESIPLPENLEKIREDEKKVKKVFPKDTEGAYENLLYSKYGLIWYDHIRHEVDIYDWNSSKKMRQLLFLAEDVKKLSLSPDGRYVVASFSGIRSRDDFRTDKTWIYDLKEREFLKYNFAFRDGVILETSDGQNVIAGISVKDKCAVLQIYSFIYGGNVSKLIYEKKFNKNQYPHSLCYSGAGKVNYLLNYNGESNFYQYDFEKNEEFAWSFNYQGKNIKIGDLRWQWGNKNCYSFSYSPIQEPSFPRIGFVLFDDAFKPIEIYFQVNDRAGGVNFPTIYNDNIFYCADKFTHKEIHCIDKNGLQITQGELKNIGVVNEPADEQFEAKFHKLGPYEFEIYNPLKYMLNGSLKPFMAIKDLTTNMEQELWPALGATFITQADPFMDNIIMVSASGGYAKLDYNETVNPSTDDINNEKHHNVDNDKNINFGVSWENSSTPIDLRAGCVFKFNDKGKYNFSAGINSFYKMPIGMAFSNINFSLVSKYTASTDYYDSNLSEHYPSLSGWPKFNEAYETCNVAIGAEYSNIHQFGVSKYQKRGFSIGLKIDSFWDIYEIRLLNRKFKYGQKDDDLVDLTEAQRQKLYDENLLQMSQLNLGLFGSIEIPMILPFTMKHGLVFNLPTSIYAEIFNKTGTAVGVNLETLLLGYEPQNGVSFMYLYFSRLGLKFGYDLQLNYDTYKVPLPDLRRKNFLWEIFTNIYVRDSIYLIYDMDFSAAIGRLSETLFNLSVKGEYFIRTKGFGVTVNFRVNY